MRAVFSLFLAGISVLGGLEWSGSAYASEVEFTAQVDRGTVSLDDSVSLKLTISSQTSGSVDGPVFNAPEFDVVNEYTSSQYRQFYDNGTLGTQSVLVVTKILKPQKIGDFKIDSIQVKVNGKAYTAPAIRVRIEPPGAAPPSSNGGGFATGQNGARRNGSGSPLRGTDKRSKSTTGFFVRSEVSKQKVVKGEQVIVSYYIYRKSQVFNLEVTKYPTLNGFFKEELEMPIAGQLLPPEQVILDGVAFERTLLVRYAAYPLQEGKLQIDSMDLKANYMAMPDPGSADDDDPFLNFGRIFNQATPKVGTTRSDVIQLEVLPLPTTGKPASFGGGVGDFEIVAVADKTELKANEAITLTVKIEGRGNAASIEAPQAKWPENFELYDTKGKAKVARDGVGEKVFEYLLIPRVSGKFTLPALELGYFDPAKNTYVTKSTKPIEVNVLEGAPGSAPPPSAKKSSAIDNSGAPKKEEKPELRYLKPPGTTQNVLYGHPVWRFAYWLSCAGLLFFIGLVLFDRMRRKHAQDFARKGERDLAESKSWQKLQAKAKAVAGGSVTSAELTQLYELLSGAVYDALDRNYGIGARSFSRSELKRMLVEEKSLAEPAWERISNLLEYAEMVRFASAAGAVSDSAAKKDLEKWVKEGHGISDLLDRVKKTVSA